MCTRYTSADACGESVDLNNKKLSIDLAGVENTVIYLRLMMGFNFSTISIRLVNRTGN